MSKEKRDTMEDAADVIQRCCDYIELYGFDSAQYGTEAGPCCYIGTARAVAELDPEPTGATYEGNGDELKIVLEALDRAATDSQFFDKANEVLEEESSNPQEPGRLIEALGFQYKEEGYSQREQMYVALAFFRKANTQIQEALGNV